MREYHEFIFSDAFLLIRFCSASSIFEQKLYIISSKFVPVSVFPITSLWSYCECQNMSLEDLLLLMRIAAEH